MVTIFSFHPMTGENREYLPLLHKQEASKSVLSTFNVFFSVFLAAKCIFPYKLNSELPCFAIPYYKLKVAQNGFQHFQDIDFNGSL